MKGPVLIIAPQMPWPPRDGWSIRHVCLIRALTSKITCDLAMLKGRRDPSDENTDSVCREALNLRHIISVQHVPWPRRVCALASLFSGRPMGELLYRSSSFRKAVQSITDDGEYESCLILGDVCMASYRSEVAPGIPVIWDMCDDVVVGYRRRAAVAVGMTSIYYKAQTNQLERYVKAVSNSFDAILVIADKEAESVKNYCAIPIIVVPNSWNVDLFTTNTHSRDDSAAQVLFTGAMHVWANRDAVQFFIDRILPKVQQEVPSVRFDVVGSGAECMNLKSAANVRVSGFVETLAPYYAECGVFVCPLRTGTGIKNKMIDAMASGCAVVTTSIGAEGVKIRNGYEAIIADDPQEFAQAVTKLLRSPDLRRRIGRNARELVMRDFGKSPATDRLLSAFDQTRVRFPKMRHSSL